MIQFGKKKRKGDFILTHVQLKEIPENLVIQIKGNRHGQIEDVNPREVNGVDLYSKYYHRDAKFISEYLADVLALNAH